MVQQPNRGMTLSLLLLLLIAGYSAADDGPLVEMPLGKVRGHTLTSRSGREYMAFTGLPYAKPPVGELRFQPPQPAAIWRGVRSAVEYGSACIQYIPYVKIDGEEDCLYLDVYTNNISRKAPVLVMFHGGSFYTGSKTNSKPTYLMDEEIVVVQVNYRLGIFGFLTFETGDLAGNQGLKDQLMALRWVKQNIGSFGGDPDRVTITGCSAGGASVHSHILSPLSRGLFHRAISASGSMYNPWALSPPGLARENAQKLMTLMGCPTEPSKAIPCIMEKDAHLIVEQTAMFINQSSGLLIFSPSLERPGSGGFLEAPISKWDPSPVPLVSILSSAEGLIITKNIRFTPSTYDESPDIFTEMAPKSLSYWASASQPAEVSKKVKDYYLPKNKDIAKDGFVNLTNMFSDALFNHGILKAANQHNGDVYFLWFDYLLPQLPEYNLKIGASHCGDSCFLWHQPGVIAQPIKSEKFLELSKAIVKSVVQFMENGTAYVPGINFNWKKWSMKDQNYLQLDRNGVFSMKSGLLQDRYKFWDTLGHQDKF